MHRRALHRRRRAWAVLAVAVAISSIGSAAARAEAAPSAVSTPAGSALVDRIPIKKTPGRAPRVVLSLAPSQLRGLAAGDTLRASAELQVSTTCAIPEPRCIGVRYDYSPNFSAQLILASSPTATGGAGTVAVTPRFQMGCGQQRPNRNHHCVITLPGSPTPISTQIPCLASGCHLNLVAAAYSAEAKTGNVLVIGGDKPDGTIKTTGGRLNAVIVPPGEENAATSAVTTAPVSPTIPLGTESGGYHTVVYSVELDGLRAGDVIAADSLQRTDVSQFDPPLFVGSEVILAGKPTAVRAKRVFSSDEGELTPANGFNCTQGPSPFQTPCSSYKAGVVTITETPLTDAGAPKPLYVNVLSRTFPKVAQAAKPAVSTVLPGGYLAVLRYPAAP